TNPGGASNRGQGTLRAGGGRAVQAVEVPVRRLDGFPECGEGEIQLLKVDVEGLEEQVLVGGRRLFAERLVRAALLEVSPEFGSTDYSAALVAELDGSYCSFRVCLRRRALRWQPALAPLAAAEVGRAVSQFSLLLVRADALHRVRRFVHWRTGRRSLRARSVPPTSGMPAARAD
ncbi:MAG: FkbM family methyltransferase, partial [Actinomycetota bacterium]|nr:FkbM family methyltransferase [Actinomycetota bacterium]